MPTIKGNGIAIQCETLGREGAPMILLIMGLGMQLIAWPEPFCERLADDDFRVVRFDNRDIGLSQKFGHLGVPNLSWAMLKHRFGWPVRAGYGLSDMAADTVGLMDALGAAKAHIVGASMGGMIAQIVAARYPARTASLTSIMSSSGARGLPGPSREAGAALLSPPPNPNNREELVRHVTQLFRIIGSPGFPVPEAELRARLERGLDRSYHPAGTARQMLAIVASGDRSPLLRTITAPTLVIHGANDPLVPAQCGRDTAAKIPGAKLIVIDGMGHDLAAWPLLAGAIVAHCREAMAQAA